jgi:uncharacterized membrane protein YGL010W
MTAFVDFDEKFPFIINMEEAGERYFASKRRAKRLAVAVIVAGVTVPWLVAGWMHQFVAWSLFGKDFPWWVDLLAGVPLAVPNLLLTFLCAVYRLGGAAVPFISL